jgi:ABC-2 type transport system permease protein
MRIGRATVLELRTSAGSRARRWLLIASGVVGLLAAGLVAFTGPARDHTFAVISFYTQSAISLPLPLVSVLIMTQEFGRRAWSTTPTSASSRDATITAKLLASALIAVAGASYGVLISVLATSAAAPPAAQERWDAVGLIILGSVLVQLIAQLSGAGWGLLWARVSLPSRRTSSCRLGSGSLLARCLEFTACRRGLHHSLPCGTCCPATWTRSAGPRWASLCLCG